MIGSVCGFTGAVLRPIASIWALVSVSRFSGVLLTSSFEDWSQSLLGRVSSARSTELDSRFQTPTTRPQLRWSTASQAETADTMANDNAIFQPLFMIGLLQGRRRRVDRSHSSRGLDLGRLDAR